VDVYQAPTWGPGGFAYLFAQIRPTDRSSQLYRLKPGGAPEAIGQRLDGTRAFTANGDVALSFSGCDSPIYAIELDASARWREIGRGCGGLPSPDGTQVALLDRTGLFMEPLHGDARERRLVSLGDLDALREHHIRPRPFVGEITWTAAGIAFLAGTYDNEGLIVRSSSGRVTVLPLGGQLVGLKWQPGGDLLAFSVGALLGPIATGNGEVRILDPNTGRLTLVAITDGFGQFAWAPDGRSLAVSKAADTTTIVDLEGHELTRLRVDGSIGDWRA
jgi:hypothetical protein